MVVHIYFEGCKKSNNYARFAEVLCVNKVSN
jgi:hypothetical protein